MDQIIWKYALAAGAIVSLMLLVVAGQMRGGENAGTGSEWLGYASMVLAFSLIYFALRNHKRQQPEATKLTFSKAVRLGFYITLIASAMYVLTWMIVSYLWIPDFMEQYAIKSEEALLASGADDAAIAAHRLQMDQYIQMYDNPFLRAGLTLLEILPMGVLMTLICAWLVTRNKPF